MIFDLLTFTLIHVVLSLVGIVSGWLWWEASWQGHDSTAGQASTS